VIIFSLQDTKYITIFYKYTFQTFQTINFDLAVLMGVILNSLGANGQLPPESTRVCCSDPFPQKEVNSWEGHQIAGLLNEKLLLPSHNAFKRFHCQHEGGGLGCGVGWNTGLAVDVILLAYSPGEAFSSPPKCTTAFPSRALGQPFIQTGWVSTFV